MGRWLIRAGLDAECPDAGAPHVMLLIRSLWARISPSSVYSVDDAGHSDSTYEYISLRDTDTDPGLEHSGEAHPRIGVRPVLGAGEKGSEGEIAIPQREIGRGSSSTGTAKYQRLSENDSDDDLAGTSKRAMPDMIERRQDSEFHGDAPDAFEVEHPYVTYIHRHPYPRREQEIFDGESIASGSRDGQMGYEDHYVYEVKADVEKAIHTFSELNRSFLLEIVLMRHRYGV